MPTNIDWDAIGRDAVATLSRYIQFDTTNPPGAELEAAGWLADQLRVRGVTEDVAVHEPAAGRGLVLARIPGSEPLRPLLVTHHMDVVGADPAAWTHPPFSGAVADGFVWGRGALDTKNLGVIFLLALESLVKAGARFRRPVIFLAVPDEETGGEHGMRWLVERHGAELDPEWVWDEGGGGFKDMLGPGVMFGLTVAEKQIQHIRLIAAGEPGHASMPHTETPPAIVQRGLARVKSATRPLWQNPVSQSMLRAVEPVAEIPASMVGDWLDKPLAQRLGAGRLQALARATAGESGQAAAPRNANVALLHALDRVLDSPRPLRVNAITVAMFRAMAAVQPFPASTLLERLDNPLALRLAAGRLQADSALNAMLRDTVSLTMLHAGYKVNVIPERAEAEIDCRLLPDTDADEFHAWLKDTLADERIQIEVTESSPPSGNAPLEGPFVDAITAGVRKHMPGAGVFPMLVPGATDGRYWRQRGYAAYGFAPVVMERSDLARVHGIDERISAENLLTGIKIARDIIETLCIA
jgi:acetylornithine deacetylase/succinyl-diaminopimelate desuccinylase-like protein